MVSVALVAKTEEEVIDDAAGGAGRDRAAFGRVRARTGAEKGTVPRASWKTEHKENRDGHDAFARREIHDQLLLPP